MTMPFLNKKYAATEGTEDLMTAAELVCLAGTSSTSTVNNYYDRH